MVKIYLYPKVYPTENPYISRLEQVLNRNFLVLNKEFNRRGVLDLFPYLLKADVFYLNWIENLPSRRYGKFQVLLFIFFLGLAKLLRKKFVWTLHNKYSHDQENNRWVNLMFRLMFRYANHIITHSQEGIDFLASIKTSYADKAYYLIHPVNQYFGRQGEEPKKYDFFIWGTIWPYKGLIQFLQYIEESGHNDIRILIAGICINDKVKAELLGYIRPGIEHIDKFLEIEEVAKLASQARYTLFTYRPHSILSSGSLMDSIGMGSRIIGPDSGAFRDLSMYGFVETYQTFGDVLNILQRSALSGENHQAEIEKFCHENSWEITGRAIERILTNAKG